MEHAWPACFGNCRHGGLPRIVSALAALAVVSSISGCGGGGGSSGFDGGGNGGGGSGNGWIPGVFLAASTFDGICAVPRAGSNDIQGTSTDEKGIM